MVGDNTQHKSSEPNNQAEERESLRGAPLSAVVAAAQADAAPSPRAAAPGAVEPDHQHGEDGGPACCEDWNVLVEGAWGMTRREQTYVGQSHKMQWSISWGSSR